MEYMNTDDLEVPHLNELGAQGWELVSVLVMPATRMVVGQDGESSVVIDGRVIGILKREKAA